MSDAAVRVAAVMALLEGRTGRADEAAIVRELESSSARVLAEVLDALDLVRLLDDVDDRRYGPRNRTRLLELLCRERLAELPISGRAKLVKALSRGRTSAADEAGIRDVFLGTKGADLTELKNRLDVGADHRDLQHIVHSDIDDDSLRA